MELLENVAYIGIAWGLGTFTGIVMQRWHTKRERKKDIKRIHDILNPEFVNIYRILMREQEVNKNARQIFKNDFPSIFEYTKNILGYLANTGRLNVEFHMWDVVIASGNLIKLDRNEIEIMQSVMQRLKTYAKTIIKLEKDMMQKINKQLSEGTIPKADIFDTYLDTCDVVITLTILWFKKLDKLSWFDCDKIKDIDQNYKEHVGKTVHFQDQIPMRFPTSGL